MINVKSLLMSQEKLKEIHDDLIMKIENFYNKQ